MPSREFHEAHWEAVPEGLDPPDLNLRRAFLLEHVRALDGRMDEHAVAAGSPTSVARPGGASPPLVLDVGCGEGQLAVALSEAGVSVVGVDVAEEPLRRARARHPGLDLGIVPAEGRWPLEDAVFDAVWAGETIEHIADTRGWLAELWRVLRPGGSLLLSTPAHGRLTLLALALSGRAFDAHFDPRTDHLRFYTRRTLTRVLEEGGFQEIRVRGAGGIPGVRRVLLAAARRPPA